MAAFVSLVTFWMLVCLLGVQCARSQQRLRLLETRLNTLETRLNIHVETEQQHEDLHSLSETISSFNSSLSNLQDMFSEKQQIVTCENENPSENVENRLAMAFKNEKRWIRKTFDILDTKIRRLEEKIDQNRGNTFCITENETETLIKYATDEVRREISDMKTNMKECREAQNQMQISIEKLTVEMNKTIPDLKMTTSMEQKSCLDGWRENDKFCYQVNKKSLNYTDARADCIKKGAHLVDISNEAENSFVKNLTNWDFWIGLTWNGDTWRWERTGEIPRYT